MSEPDPRPTGPPARPGDPARDCDVLVVGAGLNGCSIARDLAGRGLSVLLCDQDDLGAHGPGAPTPLLLHGLATLERRRWRALRQALVERERLLRAAPHAVQPLRWVLPHDARVRSPWRLRAALLLLERLAGSGLLERSAAVTLAGTPLGAPLQPFFTTGVVVADGWADVHRLAVLNARDAAARGARVLTRTACLHVHRTEDGWAATLQQAPEAATGGAGPAAAPGGLLMVRARALVNATGAHAAKFLDDATELASSRRPALVRRSHLVVRRIGDGTHGYLLQDDDGALSFAAPYADGFTLIGGAAAAPVGTPDALTPAPAEVEALCARVRAAFQVPLAPAEVIWVHAGVCVAGTDATAGGDGEFAFEPGPGAPLATVWGGAVVDARARAARLGAALAARLGARTLDWSAGVALPGAALDALVGRLATPWLALERLATDAAARWPFVPAAVLRRWVLSHGAEIETLLGGVHDAAGLGAEVAPGVFELELAYLRRHEWARTGDDVLWRRTRLALHLRSRHRDAVRQWMAAAPP